MLKSWNTEDQRRRTKEAATMNETNERSVGSRGSQPVGWGAVASDGSVVCMMRRRADVASYVVDGTPIVRLYRSPTLTDEEREAISAAACICEDAGRTDIAVIINTALERLA
jgi:hypothetical protein